MGSACGCEPQAISLAPAGGAIAFSLVAASLNHCPAASLFFVFPKLSTLLTEDFLCQGSVREMQWKRGGVNVSLKSCWWL